MKNTFKVFLSLIILFRIVSSQFTPTNEWVNFFSPNTTFEGSPVPVGAVIEAYDPNNVLCGSFTVTTEGQYGFLLVYKDDFTTPDIDEGADPGDTITFYINSTPAIPVNGTPVWTSNGDVIQLDLQTHSNFAPFISGLPDTVTFDSESFITLNLDDYVEDSDDHDSLLTWSASGYDSLEVHIDSDTRISTISSVNNWIGWDKVILKVSDPKGAFDTYTIFVHVVPVVGIDTDKRYLIDTYHLTQNYPNPFNPTTVIEYGLPKVSDVKLIIYDIKGNTIKQWNYTNQNAGYYSVVWDASNVSTGVYFYKIQVNNPAKSGADGFQQVKKMLLIK